MLQKLALAVKSKTVELFAEEEEEDDDDDDAPISSLSFPEAFIPGQRVVVVVKPDGPVISSVFAAVSAFHAAYLNLQLAHEPFQPAAIVAADRAAVFHLRRLSDLRRNPASSSSPEESQVQENQSTLRTLRTIFNRLQFDVDRKDSEVSSLKDRLFRIQSCNSALQSKIEACKVAENLAPSVFLLDSALREAFRSARGFARAFLKLLKEAGVGDVAAAATSLYPDLGFLTEDHHGYAVLSHFCLGLFDGFASDCGESKEKLLREFREHCLVDPEEILSRDEEFAGFFERKFCLLLEPSLKSLMGSRVESNLLKDRFLRLSSLVWAARRLAMALEETVEIFRVKQGTEFSVVFMENVVRRKTMIKPKVGFTVFPGFKCGSTLTIRSKVYLDYSFSSH
ncbi:DUF641 family protein (DUF641) [Wolffia australiana]